MENKEDELKEESLIQIHEKEIEELKVKVDSAIVDIRLVSLEQHQFNQRLHEHDEHLIRIEAQNNALFEIAGSMKEMKENQEQFHIETKEEIKEIKTNVNDKMDEVLDRVEISEEVVKSYEMKGFNVFKKVISKITDSVTQVIGLAMTAGILFAIYKALEFYLFKM